LSRKLTGQINIHTGNYPFYQLKNLQLQKAI